MSTFHHTVYLCVSHDYHATCPYFQNGMKRSVFLTDADCVCVFFRWKLKFICNSITLDFKESKYENISVSKMANKGPDGPY